MATGRTVARHGRVYVDGYDMSGYTRSFGPLSYTFDEYVDAAITDGTKSCVPGMPATSMGTINAFFDNTATSGMHAVMSAAGVTRTIMCPIGIRAAPAIGDPVWMIEATQGGYLTEAGDSYTYATVTLGNTSSAGSALDAGYTCPWGVLLHEKSAETAANSATGEGVDAGGASTKGGYMMYQVFSGNGTATISIDDSADDSSYSALSGATSGSIDCSSVQYGVVGLGTGATVRRYLRWQIALGTATTVTFALAFMRGF